MLTGVSAVWDAKADLKVKSFKQQVSEKMPLDQTEAVQCLAAHSELQPVGQEADQLKVTLVRKHLYYLFYTQFLSGLTHLNSKCNYMHVYIKKEERNLELKFLGNT